ncbi:hypothetical protein T05_14169 [Trichinella murrelli]|uniref:Uncharacterized protein n=1 Tax=Trichinella murrelli TaxID=144512 RepID=A0A0V0T5F6_9BILA|nr:hypothetical protein T05_14169 [Trichinella murrelli]
MSNDVSARTTLIAQRKLARSPRTDASSPRIPCFPLRSAPVCARLQTSDTLLVESYLAARADLEAMEVVHYQTKAPPRTLRAPPRLLERYGRR